MTHSHKCLLRSWRALRYFSRGEEIDERLIRRGCSPPLRHPRDALEELGCRVAGVYSLGASHPKMGRPDPLGLPGDPRRRSQKPSFSDANGMGH